MRLINIQKTVQIKTGRKAFLFIIAPSCINIALSMQKNSMLNITNFAIVATVAIIMNLGFIRTALGSVCGEAKTYTSLIALMVELCRKKHPKNRHALTFFMTVAKL